MSLVSFLSEATCGEACWEAREDVCRCSCGGKNHGCLRSKDGVRPTRNAKIDGHRYELKAVGGRELYAEAEAINKANGPYRVETTAPFYKYWWHETDRGAPARLKPATKDQLARWPELAAARAEIDALKAAGECAAVYLRAWPYLLWARVEQKEAAK
jgi:hypothetical protein